MFITAISIRLIAMVTTSRSIEEAPFARIGSTPTRNMIPLTAEQIAKIEGAGYEVCRFEGEGCEECGRSCVRVWWMRGSYEYPEEGSYYCDKCALARAVAEDRRAAFGQKYCSPCPDAGRTCWCSESDLDACIEERRFRCPEDRLLRW